MDDGGQKNDSRMELEELVKYTDAHEELYIPPTNPHRLKNNCVFVTLASLMEMDLDFFLNKVETMQPSSDVPGISINQILDLLKATKRTFFFHELNDMDRTYGSIQYCRNIASGFNVSKIGACYTTDSNSDHCILYQSPEDVFLDLQAHATETVDAPKSLRLVFAVKP